jgi:carboxymethylenebutenolidase
MLRHRGLQCAFGLAALATAAFAAWAAAPAPAPGGGTQTWADQQRSQAFATAKLAKSPRRSDWVTLKSGSRTLSAWVDYPEIQGKVPVVLVLHEVFGLTDSTRNTADEVSAMGYVTITPDMLSGYGPNGGGTSTFPTTRTAANTLDLLEDEAVYKDLEAWMDYGNRLPQANGKLGIVGLTWGGGVAFRYAVTQPRKDLKAVFVFCVAGPPVYNQGPLHHDKLVNDWPVRKTAVPVYGFYGGKDLTSPTPVLQTLDASKTAMAAAGDFYDPVVYAGAEHAFMRIGEDPANSNPANAAADKASLERLQGLLRKTFK